MADLTPLARFIEEWVDAHGITGSALFKKAGLSNALYSSTKSGAEPRPQTIRALAEVMDVDQGFLFLLAGYVSKDQLEVKTLDPQEQIILSLWGKVPPANRLIAETLLRTSAVTDEEII